MKTKFASIKSLGGCLRLGAAVGAVLLSCGAPLHTRAAAFASPVGQTWDVAMSGRHLGLAEMTFNDDGTLDVASILVPKPQGVVHAGPSDDNRGTGGDDSRNGTGGTSATNTAPAHTNIFGLTVVPRTGTTSGADVEPGQWGFDVKGRLVGYYTDVSGYSVCVTNLVPVFNPIITAWETNIVVDCNRLTNAISFVGTVVPGKRLTLLVSTPDGKSVFTGVPVTTNVPDISGNWTGIKLQNTLPNQEFFTLTRNDPSANGYAVDGTGPGYQYGGLALLFKSGKFAFFSRIPANGSDNDTEVRVRAVVGTLNERAINFRTGGLDQFANDPDDPRTRIKFTSARISTPN